MSDRNWQWSIYGSAARVDNLTTTPEQVRPDHGVQVVIQADGSLLHGFDFYYHDGVKWHGTNRLTLSIMGDIRVLRLGESLASAIFRTRMIDAQSERESRLGIPFEITYPDALVRGR